MADRLFEEATRVLDTDYVSTTETITLSRVPDYIWVDVVCPQSDFPYTNFGMMMNGEFSYPPEHNGFNIAIEFNGNTVTISYFDQNAMYELTVTVKAYVGQVMVNDLTLLNIANAIREKNGTDKKYLPSEMAGAIEAISAGGGANEVVDFVPQTETKTVTIPYTKSGTPNFICVYTKDSTSLRASGQRLIWQGIGYADDGTILHGGYAVTLESTGEIDYWNRNITYSIGDGTITITVERHMLAGVLYKIIVY